MLYGGGAEKAGTIVDPNEKNPMKLKLLGRNAINGFMDGVPALKQLKQKLANTVQERGYLRGLDGRALYCRSDFKALNVLLQGAGAMIMKQVIINTHNNLEAKGLVHGQDWVQHAMIHDEIQLSCPKKHTALVKEQALLAFPQAQQFFAFRCEIEGDAKVGWSWDQTH
jgi:DNA polymerase I-like protein with 3'-5' exonuclease and polymerase domains